jgi:hypothetical protein
LHAGPNRHSVPKGDAMLRLCVLMFLLLLAGCTAEDQRQWNDAMRDLRGDNMEMRSVPSRSRPFSD